MTYYLKIFYVPHEINSDYLIQSVSQIQEVAPVKVEFIDACDLIVEYCTIDTLRTALYKDGKLEVLVSGPTALTNIKSYLMPKPTSPDTDQ